MFLFYFGSSNFSNFIFRCIIQNWTLEMAIMPTKKYVLFQQEKQKPIKRKQTTMQSKEEGILRPLMEDLGLKTCNFAMTPLWPSHMKTWAARTRPKVLDQQNMNEAWRKATNMVKESWPSKMHISTVRK